MRSRSEGAADMRARYVCTCLLSAALVGTLAVGVSAASLLGLGSPPAGATATSVVVNAPTFSPALTLDGTVNLSTLAASQAHPAGGTPQGAAVSSSSSTYRSVDNSIMAHAAKGAGTDVPTPP